jgi:hypothetical protein
MSRRFCRIARVVPFALLALLIVPQAASSAFAGTLDQHLMEWSFALNYTDVNDFGSTTNLDGEWQYIFPKHGAHELGALVSYTSINPDDGPSTDGLILGPAYSWNWTPQSQATGYLTAAVGIVSGNLDDFYDSSLRGGVGGKFFVGNSAAVRVEYAFQKLLGKNGVDDQDSRSLTLGISLFTGKGRH